ncbi:hypothetical protein F2Q68_00045189 [Brassica cretica]|uniref:Uncharacterized protein n=1 Tax=Brassica cretica TaxID=69181 RepID=A0A8S9LKF4_BRACR|nr:hypothetical protein F2Q68_00045189 [Brassica cretica]
MSKTLKNKSELSLSSLLKTFQREKVCRSGFRGDFFWCLIRRRSSLSGDGSIRPDLRLRLDLRLWRHTYLWWTVGFCLRRPYFLLRVSSPLTAEFPLASSLLLADESYHHLDVRTCIAGRPYAWWTSCHSPPQRFSSMGLRGTGLVWL